MGFLEKLLGWGKPAGGADLQVVRARCLRCGEVLQTSINLKNDLSPLEEDEGFFTNKVLVGSGQNLCFQRLEVRLEYDAQRRLVNKTISGGEFIEE